MNEAVIEQLKHDCEKSQRTISHLVLHCSDTTPTQNFTIEKLRASHKARGFGRWPGYHLYVRRDGTLHYCRPIAVVGCHVKGHNAHSIGVCYEGGKDPHEPQDKAPHEPQDPLNPPLGGGKEVTTSGTTSHPPKGGPRGSCGSYGDTRTLEQKQVLLKVFRLLKSYYPNARILGHNEFGVAKACPCLNPPASVEYSHLSQ